MAAKNKVTSTKPERATTIELNDLVLPSIKGMDIDKEVEVTLRLKMVSKNKGHGMWYESDGESEKTGITGRFEVLEPADEEAKEKDKTPEQRAAEKIMANKKKPRVI